MIRGRDADGGPIAPLRARVWIVLAGSAAILGLWISLQTTLATWGPDADAADLPMLWFGIRQHGLSFLRSWYFTQDNWLLTLAPPAFAVFALAGAKPFLVVLSGWVIFVCCVALGLLVARRVVAPAYLVALAPFLLLCNHAVLGLRGFFTFSIDHNSSLLWGLAALLAASRWTLGGSAAWLLAIFALLVTVAVSDPWAKAAFVVPMLAASLIWTLRARGAQARRLAALAIVVAASGALAQTKLLGLLDFLPSDQLLLASWPTFNANFVALASAIAAIFDPIPLLTGSWPVTDTLICTLVAGLFGGALVRLLPRLGHVDPHTGFLTTVMLLSTAGVIAAFLVGTWQNDFVAPRFMLNADIFVPILVCQGLSIGTRSRTLTAMTGATAILIMITSVAGKPSDWLHGLRPVRTLGTVETARFLEANGLHYGYGAYWGTQSNGVSWLSREKVLIRPVMFDARTGTISPRPAQTSTLWYQPQDHPGADRTTFVIVGPDVENCPDQTRCLAGVVRQFGPPQRILAFGDNHVLVWPHDLVLPDPPPPDRS